MLKAHWNILLLLAALAVAAEAASAGPDPFKGVLLPLRISVYV